eukprot:TRINITY_DN3553_c0_g3_i1.p1 TRINITY_DN3553_c0_g3~~TRINITY_DN3553_c0_g3_i1.p1  ORF type:complete len:381 (-),score=65.08 TRINITY_DN3553_c0_g3_i1:27-1025(-)
MELVVGSLWTLTGWTILSLTLFGLAVLAAVLYFDTSVDKTLLEEEKQYYDPIKKKRLRFPSIFQAYESLETPVSLSVIAPAYNEENRIRKFLRETLDYLETRSKKNHSFTFEIIVVDDGSSDNTAKVVLDFIENEGTDDIRVLRLKKNRGKGGAVRRGMMVARGKYLLMADSDAATKFSDVENLERKMESIEKDGKGIVCGSRHHLEEAAIAERTILRNVLMWGFHFLVSFLCVRGIRDTQCGFKLFTRSAAKNVFWNLHVERWAFDVELLYLATRFGIPVAEVAVNWTEIEGSHLSVFGSSVQMGKDLLKIRLAYLFKIWKIDEMPKQKIM